MEAVPYHATAAVYDLLYEAAGKDYARESAELHTLIQNRCPGATTLLDVACGTGLHLAHLARWYGVVGADVTPAMLERARHRLPDVELHEADMRTLRLDRRFDAVVCLFSSIGYMPSTADLDRAVATMGSHLAEGGVLVLDGWVRPDAWRGSGSFNPLAGERDGLAVTRLGIARRDGRRTSLEMHHLIGRDDRIDHVVERHDLTLFDDVDYRRAFEQAGLSVEVMTDAMPDRDRYIGIRPP